MQYFWFRKWCAPAGDRRIAIAEIRCLWITGRRFRCSRRTPVRFADPNGGFLLRKQPGRTPHVSGSPGVKIGASAANAAPEKDPRLRKRRDLLKTPPKRHPRRRGSGVINLPFLYKRRLRGKFPDSEMSASITKSRRNGHPPLEIGGVGSIIPTPLLMRRDGPDFGVLKCLLIVRNAA